MNLIESKEMNWLIDHLDTLLIDTLTVHYQSVSNSFQLNWIRMIFRDRIEFEIAWTVNRYIVYMDTNGDTQGNYTLIGQQPYEKHQEHGLYPVGLFHIPKTNTSIPVLQPNILPIKPQLCRLFVS